MSQSVAFWFRRRYNLPPTDPRFLDATLFDMMSDFWAHHYAENPDAAKEAIDDDFNLDAELRLADQEAGDLPNDFEEI